jgi:two-component system, chemotaxis family, sensor kinase CheA
MSDRKKPSSVSRRIFMGKRYSTLTTINDQVRYMTMNAIFMMAIIPLVSLGITMMDVDIMRTGVDFGIAFLCVLSLILIRTKMPLRLVPLFPVTIFGLYCLYLLYTGHLNLWAAVWIFSFPLIVIFLCQIVVGIVESSIMLAGMIFILFAPFAPPAQQEFTIRIRFVMGYILVMGLAIVYEYISIKKDQKEKTLKAELAQEKNIIQTMKDNINQGIFMMNSELKILPLYSKPLIPILSYYDSELAGKNFLDTLSASLDTNQLQTMKGYFSMIFTKAKSAKVLESANPIAEFEYRIDDRVKTLTTKFNLIEQPGAEPVIIGIIQDNTREKEYEKDLRIQREAQELEMKNMFDVLQIDPLVFNDFIEDTEANFNYINSILKDRSLTEKQALTKFFQNVHAIKSNALILGLDTFGRKLHTLEDEIKVISAYDKILVEDVLGLAIKLESILKEKDEYVKITKKIEAFKTSNQIDTILIHSLTNAVEKLSDETQKKVELKAGQVDIGILESKLRKPIKDILFQCVRNSICHGIEPVDERIRKNKKPVGLLVFSIKNVGDKAEITFSDDGRGLDWKKIKAKYIALNPDAKEINKKILLGAVFSPEFSTSEETGTIAGRGVGLSLVKDLVKENLGTIKVDSTESGLTFKFIFPIPDGQR